MYPMRRLRIHHAVRRTLPSPGPHAMLAPQGSIHSLGGSHRQARTRRTILRPLYFLHPDPEPPLGISLLLASLVGAPQRVTQVVISFPSDYCLRSRPVTVTPVALATNSGFGVRS